MGLILFLFFSVSLPVAGEAFYNFDDVAPILPGSLSVAGYGVTSGGGTFLILLVSLGMAINGTRWRSYANSCINSLRLSVLTRIETPSTMRRFLILSVQLTFLGSVGAQAETFLVTPNCNPKADVCWETLENAKAGDVVEIAPGTYRYRVNLSRAGTASAPIIIRAQDPNNRPVWNMQGDRIEKFPGSYSGGDLGRGCWQVRPSGAYYEISGIVFEECRSESAAGIRLVDSGPVTIRDSRFYHNTSGINGSSSSLLIEYCEFDRNGKTFEGGNPSHNTYIFGGKLVMRYNYSHDVKDGQLFHLRVTEGLLENNWFENPGSYVGDLMVCNTQCTNTQSLTLRGNVLVQGPTGTNNSKLLEIFHSRGTPGDGKSMHVRAEYNTFIGNGLSGSTKVINLSNDKIDITTSISNNIFIDMAFVTHVNAPSLSNWSVTGSHNWVSNGTNTAGLSNTSQGTTPGFENAAVQDFRLSMGSTARNTANSSPSAPKRELFRDARGRMFWRNRASANDPGAFEYGNSAALVGPYDGADFTAPSPPRNFRGIAIF